MNTDVKREKRVPAEVAPNQEFKLVTVRNFADKQGITTTRVYQKFQEGTIEIVTVDGVQFVKQPNQ